MIKETKEFEGNEFFEDSIKLRKFDEAAKKTDLKIKSINEYKNLLFFQTDMRFDYIIIGAGSAGCVLAIDYPEDKNNKVAVFEAGKSSDIFGKSKCLLLCYTHA